MIRLMMNDRYETIPWDEIDAVVFDIGNVLLDYSPEQILRERLPERPELHETLKRKIMRSPYWIMLDHGSLTLEEAVEAMTGHDKELEPYIRRVAGEPARLRDALPEGVAALKKCKAMGKKVYVLSNFHDGAYDWAAEHHDFFRLLDGEVVSSRVGMVKPDPAIFRYLSEKFGLDASRVLFVDDSPANIEAALMSGWQGLCYSGEGVLAKFFDLENRG